MITWLRKSALVLAVVTLGVATAPVRADDASTTAILRECADTGVIGEGHTAAELREASANMPADAAEYSPCGEQIGLALARLLATPTPTAEAITRGLAPKGSRVRPDELAAALQRAVEDGANISADLRDGADATAADEAGIGADVAVVGAARATEPQLGDPAAKAFGNAVAGATVLASLLALARPAMLRRRRLHDS
ncbi:MAG: hypothetical protein J7513_05945 [Solirubrobacteraceae bacterium]|nr:hypothetical protein [Solirubrobacteraceae bacterium]